MPAIPIYRSSPINAAKPSGVSPETAQAVPGGPSSQEQVEASSTRTPQAYPVAEPESRPSLPKPTGAPQPTPTRTTHEVQPPPPQPGAAPVPPISMGPGSTSKAADSQREQQQQAVTTTMPPMPPQMSFSPPSQGIHAHQIGSMTSTAPPKQNFGPEHASLPSSGPPSGFAHPPGYQQDIHASELNSNQRAAHEAWASQSQRNDSTYGAENEEGVWDTAKKWAVQAGESLAAAENEVWKRINKE